MKSFSLAIFTCLTCIFFVACGGGDSATSLSLAEISVDNYPQKSNVWIIVDSTATTSDFAGLSGAIQSLAKSGREVKLQLPNMRYIPDYAIYGQRRNTKSSLKSVEAIVAGESSSDDAFIALTSIDAPVALSVGDFAFYGCHNLSSFTAPQLTSTGNASLYECSSLTSLSLPELESVGELSFAYCSQLATVELPKVTQIGALAFHVCHSLRSISLATKSGVTLTTLGAQSAKSAFLNASTPETSLTLGDANKGYVNGNTINIDQYNIQFKEIIIQNR